MEENFKNTYEYLLNTYYKNDKRKKDSILNLTGIVIVPPFDNYEDTPFGCIAGGYLDKFKEFLDNGIDINSQNMFKESLLYQTIFHHKKDMFDLLLARGACPNIPTAFNGITAIHLAAQQDDPYYIEELCKIPSVDINIQDAFNLTPLHFSVLNNKKESFKFILNHPNTDINATAVSGFTALHFAVLSKHLDMITDLLLKNVKVNISGTGNQTPLHIIAKVGGVGQVKIMTLLMQAGANVNALDSDGKSAVHYIAHQGNAALLGLMLSYGADLLKPTSSGDTVSSIAHNQGHSSILELLKSEGHHV